MPKSAYQKLCSQPCEAKWINVRDTLLAAGPREIQLTDGSVATVDGDDYECVSQFYWFPVRQANGKSACPAACIWFPGQTHGTLSLAQYIMEVPQRIVPDHKNRNPLNNQRSNLRLATQKQNSQNKSKRLNTSSQYKGVSWRKEVGRWIAYIVVDGTYKHLGYFPPEQEEEAALAYDTAAIKAFGEFACLNFPELATHRQALVNAG